MTPDSYRERPSDQGQVVRKLNCGIGFELRGCFLAHLTAQHGNEATHSNAVYIAILGENQRNQPLELNSLNLRLLHLEFIKYVTWLVT